MSDDLDEKGLEAATEAYFREGFKKTPTEAMRAAIRAYKAAEGVGPLDLDDVADALWQDLLPLMQIGAGCYLGSVYADKVAALARIRSALAAPQPSQSRDEVVEASRFLLERLDDFDSESDVDLYRQFAGHVYPAMGRLRLALSASPQREGWRDIEDNPPLDREFLGANVGTKLPDGRPRAERIWHIRGRHMEYAGGPSKWTWNSRDGMYGIVLTHWREMPSLPTPPKEG